MAPLPSQSEIDAVMKALEEAKATMEKAGAQVAEKTAAVAKEAKPAAPAPAPMQDIGAMLASADVGKGKRVFNKCKSCHTVNNGGKNGIGPNLWNIINRTPGEVGGYKYSGALAGMTDRPWNYENLNAFLLKPKKYAKGTKMSFAGLKKDSDRANVIAYLRSLSDNPAPLK